MTTDTIKMVINHVQSQILMRQNDVNSFAEWLKAGNYNEETDLAEIKCRKGQSFSFANFAMNAWKKFNS